MTDELIPLVVVEPTDALQADFDAYGNAVLAGEYVAALLTTTAPRRLAAWKAAAKAGSPLGRILYGECLAVGVKCEADAPAAFELFLSVAEDDYLEGMWLTGECLLDGAGTPRDRKAALAWFAKAAEGQYPPAEYSYGLMHLDGLAVRPDALAAAEWFLRAANHGYVPAQYKLGKMLLKGEDLKPDYEFGLQLMHKAARTYLKAQQALGAWYSDPKLGPPNPREAQKWLREAAKNGSGDAMYQLGRMSENAVGMLRDERLAAEWYVKAAVAGHVEAAYRVGKFYFGGIVLPVDPAEGVRWLTFAALKGHKEAGLELARRTAPKSRF